MRLWMTALALVLAACGNDEPSSGGAPYDGGADEVAGIDALPTDGGSDASQADSVAGDTGTPDIGTPDTGTPDTGTPDTGTPDTGTPDTGTPDIGTPDTNTPDTGTPDTGTPDTGTPDTGTPDTGTPDTNTPDTGTPDTGTPDTGTPDTGTPDTGTPDTGTTDTGTTDTGTADASTCTQDSDCSALKPGVCQVAKCTGGSCALATAANGTACEDTDPCTGATVCTGGACGGGKPVCNVLPAGMGASPCTMPGELAVASDVELKVAFPKISSSFGSLTFLTHPHDGTDRVVVVERKGRVWAFDNDPNVSSKTQVLDISGKVATISEGGLLSVAFHPDFGKNGRLFLSYTAYLSGQFSSVFSEIQVNPTTLVAKLPTEKTLLTIKQPYANHDGGQIFFDKAGMLVIGMGDGGSAGDPLKAGQDATTMLGAVLRIDVDNVPFGKTYGIPKDNPNKAGWLPEIWAIGVRNPWRMSVDRQTGVIWAGDVGQGKWEEVSTVPGGANLGWRLMEGNHCYNPSNCNKTGLHLPVFEYSHSLGKSITGGYVYRGKDHPTLNGMYLFGDYVSRRYWGLWQEGGAWKSKVLLQSSSVSPASFGEDRDGEVYVLTLSGANKIYRLQPKAGATTGTPPPAKLSQSGCFTSLSKLTPANGVLRYGLNAPLWSDGAAKARFVVLPKKSPGSGPAAVTLPKDDHAAMALPQGTILIKHFGLGTGAPGTPQSTPVETRFMVHGKQGWVFWTYTWNAQGTDADLELGGSNKSYLVAGTGKKQTWPQPSTADCAQCHGSSAGSVPLGVTAAQLNGGLDYTGAGPVNQLAVWAKGGLFGGGYLGAPEKHQAMISQPWGNLGALSKADKTAHARAWLHVQCASCHQPGGTSQANLDLRIGQTLAQTQACNVSPGFGSGGIAGAKIIVPGKSAQSVLYKRVSDTPGGTWFMPHIGVSVPDTEGVALIKAWIDQLTGCQ